MREPSGISLSLLYFFGVDGHRLEMDADQRCELDAVLLLVGLKVGRRLEVVGVEVLVVEGEVQLNEVRELSHLQFNAFLFKLRLDEVEDVGVRHRRRADADHVGSGGRGRKGSAGKDGGSGCAGEGFQGKMKNRHGSAPGGGSVEDASWRRA